MIATRAATADDLRFVAASWFMSYWKGAMLTSGIEYATFKAGQDARIHRLFERSDVIVAAFKSVPEEILGYVVREGALVHYVYVKSDFRRQRIAAHLLKGAAEYTHKTPVGAKVARALKLSYNPYKLDL